MQYECEECDVKKFDRDKVNILSNYPFLERIDELNLPEGKKYFLRYGEHKAIPPFVEVIIPTYKRPHMLKKTLQSIMASIEFSDYQIIIMDNEGVAEYSGITETEQLIIDLDDSRIVYYREEENTPYNWNHLINVTKAKWLCMVHDDDLIDPYHLKIMSSIVKNKSNIEFLGCRRENFFDENYPTKTVGEKDKVKLIQYDCKKFLWGFQTILLGAFFKRENAIELGGFDTTILSGIGDYIFVAKQAYYYNTYCCDLPLYKYRISMEQQTANDIGEFNCRISDFFLMRAIAKRTHPILWKLYYKLIDRNWINKVQAVCKDKTYAKRSILIEEVCELCNVDLHEAKKKNIYYILYLVIHNRELHFPTENILL